MPRSISQNSRPRCTSGASAGDDGLMIHLGAMSRVVVDPDRRRARAGGGATWAEVDAATQAHGLAVTGGVASDTGVGGLTLGGGMGWLSNRHRLVIDSLESAEVVLANGGTVTSATEHPDLFWALRGGGGNFGVVTEFEYPAAPDRTPPPAAQSATTPACATTTARPTTSLPRS